MSAATGRMVRDEGSRTWHMEMEASRKTLCGHRINVPQLRGFDEPYPAIDRVCLRCAKSGEFRAARADAFARSVIANGFTRSTRGDTPEHAGM